MEKRNEEETRRNTISLMFQQITRIAHSFEDYEHLLRAKKQLIPQDELPDKSELEGSDDEDFDDGERELLLEDLADDDGIQVTIRTFQNLQGLVGHGRSV